MAALDLVARILNAHRRPVSQSRQLRTSPSPTSDALIGYDGVT